MAFSDDKVIFIKRAIFVSADCIGNSDVESIRASAENFFISILAHHINAFVNCKP
jgi:hypothetical protein